MKNILLCIVLISLASCNPRVSINSGRNDKTTVEEVAGFNKDSFQVTYEETTEDRKLRKELLDSIRDYPAEMPELDQSIVYKVQYKSPKNVSFFIGDLECAYQFDREVIEEKITEVNETEKTYTIEKRSTPVMETIRFMGVSQAQRNRCNLDIDQLNTENTLPKNLEEHLLKVKAIATERLNDFADMCRYGGFMSTGEDCFGHRIEVTKDLNLYTLNSEIQAESRSSVYSWQLSLEAPQFTLGFERQLFGETPEFETLNPHFYYGFEIL